MDTPRRKALAAVLACIACAMSGVGRADQPVDIVVPYGDLDLNTRYGVTAMYARLEDAAKTVCTKREGPLSSHSRISACVDLSVRQAVVQIGAPRLVVLYETRTGHALLHAARSSSADLTSAWASR